MQATTVTFSFNNILPKYRVNDLEQITEWLDFDNLFHMQLRERNVGIADSDIDDDHCYVEVYVGVIEGQPPHTIKELTDIVRGAAQDAFDEMIEQDAFVDHKPTIEVL